MSTEPNGMHGPPADITGLLKDAFLFKLGSSGFIWNAGAVASLRCKDGV